MKKIKRFFSMMQIKIYNKIFNRNVYMNKLCNIYKRQGVKFGNVLPRYIDPSVELDGSTGIYIGEYSTIAAGTIIMSHDYSIDYAIKNTFISERARNAEYKVAEEVRVGNRVFIGQRVMILPGVQIGDNSIVGAYSLVNKDIPPNEVWGGCPAKYISTIDEYVNKCLRKRNIIPPVTLVELEDVDKEE